MTYFSHKENLNIYSLRATLIFFIPFPLRSMCYAMQGSHISSYSVKKWVLLLVLLFLTLGLENAWRGTSNLCQVPVVICIVVIME